jgi:hypothetical protein
VRVKTIGGAKSLRFGSKGGRFRARICRLAATLVALSFVASGCGDQPAFQQTARVTLGQVSDYETQVDAKVKAENAYATDMVRLLQGAAKREGYDDQRVVTESQGQAFASEVVTSEGKVQPKAVSDFSMGVVTAISASRSANEALEGQLSNALPASLATINAQTASLAPVKADLAELQSSPSGAAQVKEWAQYAIQVRDKIKTNSSEQAGSSK